MRVAVGISQNHDPRAAVFDALAQSIDDAQRPDLTVIFYAGKFDPDAVWQAACSKLAGRPFMGGSVAGIFTDENVFREEPLPCRSMELLPALDWYPPMGREYMMWGSRPGEIWLMTATRQYGDDFAQCEEPRLSVLIRGVYSRLGPEFQYIGAGTGTQFTEEGHTNDGVALAMIKNVHFTLGTGHGWIPFGEPMLITRIEGHRIYELDGQPAATRFRNAIRQVA